MIEMINQIYTIGFVLWLFLIPFGIYKGYYHGKKEFKTNPINYNLGLIVILPNGIENYTIFMFCCIYCLIYFVVSLTIGIIIHYLFFL